MSECRPVSHFVTYVYFTDVSCVAREFIISIRFIEIGYIRRSQFNPLMGTGNYSATSNNMKLVHWPLMGGLLLLVQQGGDWAGPQPAHAPHCSTKCNSPPISGQCTNRRIAV